MVKQEKSMSGKRERLFDHNLSWKASVTMRIQPDEASDWNDILRVFLFTTENKAYRKKTICESFTFIVQ